MGVTPLHQILDAHAKRRVFAFGDVHGNLNLLEATLQANGYDAKRDLAVGMGDWMDRGPAGLADMNAFLDRHPEIEWIRGNHDDMLLQASHPSEDYDQEQAAVDLYRNGGRWIIDHIDDETGLPDATATALADRLNAKPVALTVLTPGGRRVGLVHAGVRASTWTDMVAALEGPEPQRSEMAHECLWMRKAAEYAIAEAERGVRCDDWIIEGVDFAVYGHTIVREPVRHGNQIWIDTGAYATGILTMIDLDQI